jgi:hypothetical protein
MGMGGLSHLGVQFGVKMGFMTVAIALGGATVILATSSSGKAFAAVPGGLGIGGKMIILLAVSLRIFPEPSPTVGESRERVPRRCNDGR